MMCGDLPTIRIKIIYLKICVTGRLYLMPMYSTNVPEYSSNITRTFAIDSLIVVAISHILSAIYLNSNECSGSTSGCNRGILLKIHNFHWSRTSTEDANMVGIGK